MARAHVVESPFLLEQEAAAYLRISVTTLVEKRKAQAGPRCRQHGRRGFLYRISDLDQWSDEHAVGADAAADSDGGAEA